MMKIIIIGLLGSIFMLNACESSNKSKSETNSVFGVEWKLLSVKSPNSSDLIVPEDTNNLPTLLFDKENKSVSGSAGCNRLMGRFTLKGSSLVFSKMVTTLMMCQNMQIEVAVGNALENTDTYAIKNNELLLMKGDIILATYSK